MTAPPTLPIKVMIVDDHAVVRDGLTAILEGQSDMQVVAASDSGDAALLACETNRPDVMLLDVRMSDGNGIETLKRIRRRFPNVKVLMFSSHDGDDTISRSMQAGASGYLLKNMLTPQVVAAIRGVVSGKVTPSATVAERLKEHAAFQELSPRELEVLSHLARGCSNREIGQALGLSPHTARNHLNNLMQKLDVSDRTEAVTVGLRRGLIGLD